MTGSRTTTNVLVSMSLPGKLSPDKQHELQERLMRMYDELRADWTAEEFLIGLAGQVGSLAGAINAIRQMRAHDALEEIHRATGY